MPDEVEEVEELEQKTPEDMSLEELEDALGITDELEEESPVVEEPEEEPEEEDPKPEEDPEPKPEEEGDPEPVEEPTEEPEEDEKPKDNSAWAKHRREMKKLKEELAKAKNPEPVVDTAKDAVSKLVKVWDSGEGNDRPMLASVRSASTAELVEIHKDAVAGKYGDHSDDVIKMVQQEMPVIQAREAQETKTAQERRDSVRKEFDDELKFAKSDFPAFAKEGSDGEKFLNEFTEKIAGKIDDSGKHDGNGDLPEELSIYLHTHPYVLNQLADRVFKAKSGKTSESSKEVSKLKAERDSYRKRLQKYEGVATPSTSSAPAGDKLPSEMSLDELDKQIQNL